MGFLDTIKEAFTNKPSTLREPTFIKEFVENNKQLEELEKLLNIAHKEISKEIEKDIKLLSYGINGEKNIAYELKHSHMPILILHDLYLEYKGLTAQIDYVVIHPRFILVIECKNMVGEIEITNNDDFIRCFKGANGRVYKKEGIYSPIVQNERHVELIKDILKGDEVLSKNHIDVIRHIVAVANPKTIVNSKYAKKEIKEHIIKHEQLINTMKALHEANKEGYWLTEENMYKVANALMKYNGTYRYDYEQKYGVSVVSVDDGVLKEEIQEIICEEKTIEPELKSSDEETNITEESPIYKELREYRLNKSREEMVKPYIIYNNQELESIIKAKPKTTEELISIKGFGKVKCDKYGADIIEIINKY